MPTNITELEDTERGKTILRIEGSLMREDAVLTPEQRAEAAKMKEQFKENFKGRGKKRFGGKAEAPATE